MHTWVSILAALAVTCSKSAFGQAATTDQALALDECYEESCGFSALQVRGEKKDTEGASAAQREPAEEDESDEEAVELAQEGEGMFPHPWSRGSWILKKQCPSEDLWNMEWKGFLLGTGTISQIVSTKYSFAMPTGCSPGSMPIGSKAECFQAARELMKGFAECSKYHWASCVVGIPPEKVLDYPEGCFLRVDQKTHEAKLWSTGLSTSSDTHRKLDGCKDPAFCTSLCIKQDVQLKILVKATEQVENELEQERGWEALEEEAAYANQLKQPMKMAEPVRMHRKPHKKYNMWGHAHAKLHSFGKHLHRGLHRLWKGHHHRHHHRGWEKRASQHVETPAPRYNDDLMAMVDRDYDRGSQDDSY